MIRTFALASLTTTAAFAGIGWLLFRTGAAFDLIGWAPRVGRKR